MKHGKTHQVERDVVPKTNYFIQVISIWSIFKFGPQQEHIFIYSIYRLLFHANFNFFIFFENVKSEKKKVAIML